MSGTSTPSTDVRQPSGAASARKSRAGPSPWSTSARIRSVSSSTKSETRAAATLHNEKSICGIGRDMVTSGRLHSEGCAMALEALARFRMLADGLNVTVREAVATAAARDASNGAEFVRRAEAAWGAPVRVLSGEDEARIAAEGVIAGIPAADGLVADLGGGSLDMVSVRGGKTGDAFTLPFGPLRLMDGARGDADKARKLVDEGLGKLDLRGMKDRSLYAVGGIWRSFARVDMEAIDLSAARSAGIRDPAQPRAAALQGAVGPVAQIRRKDEGRLQAPRRVAALWRDRARAPAARLRSQVGRDLGLRIARGPALSRAFRPKSARLIRCSNSPTA